MALHGASREAVAGLRSQLGERAGSTDLTELGGDLFSVTGLLVRESALRRALGDPATDPDSRRSLARRLLEGKISDAALVIVESAAGARWSKSSEFVEGTEQLARTALLVHAEREGRLDAVEDELFRLGRIVAGSPELERVLSDPSGDRDGKTAVLRSLIGDKVEPVTATLVEQLIAIPRGRTAVAGLEELADAAAQRREQSVARVRTAVALSEAQQQRLTSTLERIYGRSIALHIEVDPSLGGGLVVQIGDEVIDGSVTGRLDALKRRLS